MSSYYPFSFASIALALLAAPAAAQEAQQAGAEPVADGVVDREGVISYTPADFADARPNTALDMINRLPGFSLDGGDNVRGFAGAAGNVLIDGQRPTTKSDGLGDQLGRIQIGQVERIDLIRGSAPGIDMQGQPVVANVIRKKADTFQQVLGVGGLAFAKTGKNLWNWSYQGNWRSGDQQIDFSLSRGIAMDDSVGFGWRTIADPLTGAQTAQLSQVEGDGVPHSGRINYKGPLAGGTLSVNASAGTDEFKNETYYSGGGVPEERFLSRSANDRGEIGVNYKLPIGEGLEAEALALSKIAFGKALSTGASGPTLQAFQVEAEAGETIGRGILRWRISPELSVEGGGETAFNYREQSVGLSVNGAPVPLPASDVRVEEVRGEAFVQGTWRPSPQWSLEGGVRVEKSTITQTGDTERERSFTYAKPRAILTWSPTETDQLRLRAEREVGQLNFQDFASSVDLNSDVVTSGNAELEPDKTWTYEATYEKRFWEGAAAVLTFRHDDISDVQDQFPFVVSIDQDGDGDLDQVRVAGPGNIGDGTNDAVIFNLTLPLAPVGLKGGELKVETMWQESEVRDPLTGENRRISGQRPDEVNVSFRQDLPELDLSYGFGWFAGWRENYYRLREVESLKLRDYFFSFIEWKPTDKFTLRAELNNLDPFSFTIRRDVFDQPRDVGSLVEVETQRRNSQVIGQVRARWTLG